MDKQNILHGAIFPYCMQGGKSPLGCMYTNISGDPEFGMRAKFLSFTPKQKIVSEMQPKLNKNHFKFTTYTQVLCPCKCTPELDNLQHINVHHITSKSIVMCLAPIAYRSEI